LCSVYDASPVSSIQRADEMIPILPATGRPHRSHDLVASVTRGGRRDREQAVRDRGGLRMGSRSGEVTPRLLPRSVGRALG
jgi:hypothetical protein